jgi:hypothetical protein
MRRPRLGGVRQQSAAKGIIGAGATKDPGVRLLTSEGRATKGLEVERGQHQYKGRSSVGPRPEEGW